MSAGNWAIGVCKKEAHAHSNLSQVRAPPSPLPPKTCAIKAAHEPPPLTHTHTHTRIHTCICMHIILYSCTQAGTSWGLSSEGCECAQVFLFFFFWIFLVLMCLHIQTRVTARRFPFAHTHTHTHKHTYTHTHTHTHIHFFFFGFKHDIYYVNMYVYLICKYAYNVPMPVTPFNPQPSNGKP